MSRPKTQTKREVTKKFRPPDEATWNSFIAMMTGDSALDFEMVYRALIEYLVRNPKERSNRDV